MLASKSSSKLKSQFKPRRNPHYESERCHRALGFAIAGLGMTIGAKWCHLNAFGLGLAFMSAVACTVMIVNNSITMKRAESIVVIF